MEDSGSEMGDGTMVLTAATTGQLFTKPLAGPYTPSYFESLPIGVSHHSSNESGVE